MLTQSLLLLILFSTVTSQASKGCDPANFPSNCDGSQEKFCQKPELDNGKYACDSQDELQIISTETNQQWKKIDPFTCVDDGNGPKFNGQPILSPTFEIHEMRCVRMNINYFFDTTVSECDPNKCKRPTDDCSSIVCHPGYSLEMKFGNKWEKVQSLTAKCNSDKFTGILSNGNPLPSNTVGIRCIEKVNCEDFVILDDCSAKETCKTPTAYDPTVTCDPTFALQANSGGKWMNVKKVSCDDKMNVIDANDAPLSTQADAIRCMRVKCDAYYDDTDCIITSEICKKPNFGASLGDPISCDPDFTLQVKTGGKWEEVQESTCNTGTFTAKLTNNIVLKNALLEGVRCLRMKCAMCDNPCPSCVSSAIYKKATKSDECTTFSCVDHSRMTVATVPVGSVDLICESAAAPGFNWIQKNSGAKRVINGDATCEILCTQKIPLTDTCNPNDYLCEKKTIGDDLPVTCAATSKLIYKSSTDQTETVGSRLLCDKQRGVWVITKEDGTTEVDIIQSGNVTCRYEDCKIAEFCPDCEKEAGSSNKYRCKPDNTVEIRDSSSPAPRSLDPFTARFVCKRGKWEDENEVTLIETATVNCIPITTTLAKTTALPITTLNETTVPYEITVPTITTAQPKDNRSDSAENQVGIGAATYALIIFAILIITLAIVCIACKLGGKGWLHTIILTKLRGGKKKESKSKAGTSKEVGSPRASVKAQWQAGSPRVDKGKEGDQDDEGDTTGETGTTGGITDGNGGSTEEVQTTFDV